MENDKVFLGRMNCTGQYAVFCAGGGHRKLSGVRDTLLYAATLAADNGLRLEIAPNARADIKAEIGL